jgi:hypothetical protein
MINTTYTRSELLIKEAVTKYKFVRLSHDTSGNGVVELYADNYMLSSFRKCEAFFVESILNRNIKGKAWFFDFGIWIHSCIEYMYTRNKAISPLFCTCPDLVDYGAKLWNELKIIQYHSQHKAYIKMGGFSGAAKLLLDYWRMYGENRETYKIIGTELPFGAKKEVYLGEIIINSIKVRCYYSGRIDIIVDDGQSLGVMDTKSAGKFSGDEINDFNPHEGMEGYVFSLREIVRQNFPDIKKPCNRVVINHVSVNDCTNFKERFKRTPITYSLEQLDEWRTRQLRTFKKLYEIIVLNETPDWNTDTCNNMYFQDCAYKELHRNSPSSRDILRKSNYIQIEPWDCYREGK